MSDPMDDYDDEEMAEHEPKRRGVSAFASRAVGAVGGAAKAVADSVENTTDKMRIMVDRMDKWAGQGRIGHYFSFKQRRAKLSTEIRSGVITFLMVAYVLAVNPEILSVTGGTCDPQELCDASEYQIRGNSCLFHTSNPEASDCLSTLKMSLTTATAAVSLISSFFVGFFANLPLALAPGMGINIYVAYQVVSQDILTYEQAMVAIFIEGWIFILLSVTGVRGGIITMLPKNIAFASSVGIGLLLALSGLRNLGVVVYDGNTLLTLGGCPAANRQYIFTSSEQFDLSEQSGAVTTLNLSNSAQVTESSPSVYACEGGEMRSATMWLGFAGGLLMAGLTAGHVRGALFIGICFVTIISWIPGSAVSYLGEGSATPGGAQRMEVFKQVVAAPSLDATGLAWDWSAVTNGHFWVVLFTFLYIDLLDCTGTLLSMAHLLDDCMQRDAEEEGKLESHTPFLSDAKEFDGQQWAFLSDGIGIITGSMMGITPVSVYMESAAGIEDGGRTGVSAITVAFFFFISLFFSPILASIPAYATGPALILIGVMLIAHVDRIAWDNTLESIPAFLTLIIMPFTLSVAYGVIAGIAAHLALHVPIWLWQKLTQQLAKMKKNRRRKRREKQALEGGVVESEDDDDHPANGGGPPSVSSFQRGQRRVHRKIFGLESNRSTSESGSIRGDLAYLEMVEGYHTRPSTGYGFAPAAGAAGAGGAGLRRSISHGSFKGMAAAGRTSPHGPMASSIARMSAPRPTMGGVGIPSGGAAGVHSGFPNSRSPSWGHEPVLGSTAAVGGTGAGGYPRGGLPRTASGQSMGLGGLGRSMTRSRTFTEAYTSNQYVQQNEGRVGGSIHSSPSASGHGSFQLFPTDGESNVTLGSETVQEAGRFSPSKPLPPSQRASTTGATSPPPPPPTGAAGDNFMLFGGGLLNIDLDKDSGDEEENYVTEEPLTLSPRQLKAATSSENLAVGSMSPPSAALAPPANENLLFGGALLNLNLDADSDEEEQQQHQEEVTNMSSSGQGSDQQQQLTPTSAAAAQAQAQAQADIPNLGSMHTADMDTIESVDLVAFKLGVASGSDVGSPPEDMQHRDSMNSEATFNMGHSGGTSSHHHITTGTSNGGGSGSSSHHFTGTSFQIPDAINEKEPYLPDSEAQPQVPLTRVEGWPASPTKDSNLNSNSPQDVQRRGSQSAETSQHGPSRVKNKGFDMISSEAANRLRNLFILQESSKDLGRGPTPPSRLGGGGSRPQQLPRVLSSPASFIERRNSLDRTSAPPGTRSSSSDVLGTSNEEQESTLPASPFDQ